MRTLSIVIRALALVLCASSFTACGILKAVADTPGEIVGSGDSKKDKAGVLNEARFADLTRFADVIVLRMSTASHEFEADSDDMQIAIQAARWRLQAQNWTARIVGGSNTTTNLLDLVVISTISGWLHADHWSAVYGERDRPVETALENSAADGWVLLARYLDEKQIKSVHAVLDKWRAEHPKMTREALLEVPNFQALLDQEHSHGEESGNLLGVVGLDPLSNLEPVTRQVELIRRLGERAAYFAERAPALISSEVELRVLEMRASPEVKGVLANIGTVSASMDRYATLGEKLPESVRAEREAAIEQFSKVVKEQREGLVHDLSTSEKPLRELLERSQSTLETATRTSASLTEMVHAAQAFMEHVAPKPAPGTPPPPPAPPGKPFDINEYTAAIHELGSTAERLGATTRDVKELLTTLDQRMPEVQRAVDATARRGEAAVHHALLLGVIGGLILIAAAAGAAIFVRRMRPR